MEPNLTVPTSTNTFLLIFGNGIVKTLGSCIFFTPGAFIRQLSNEKVFKYHLITASISVCVSDYYFTFEL